MHVQLLSVLLLLLACGDKNDGGGVGSGGITRGDGGGDAGGGDGGGGSVDADDDGWAADQDCDDSDPAINPGALELCDGLDNDCDDVIDEDSAEDAPVWCRDADGDGSGDSTDSDRACVSPGVDYVADCDDCDDADSAFHPGAAEDDCTDPNDYDCDGTTVYADDDGDGVAACEDCDDEEATVFEGAPELCDGLDNDCDGLVDDDDAPTDPSWWYTDSDGDGHGVAAPSVQACDPGDGWSLLADDCNDADATVNPTADEICDDLDIDQDCNSLADDNDDGVLSSTLSDWYTDADGDGHGDEDGLPTWRCDDPSTGPDAYADEADDCNDDDDTVHPDADEICDDTDTDEDCSGLADDDDPAVVEESLSWWVPDADGDGFGDDSATPAGRCEDPSGPGDSWVQDDSDCDDDNDRVHPDATELCDDADTDEDCDGLVDDEDDSLDVSTATRWYVDEDGDGYGSSTEMLDLCDSPGAGWEDDDDDCNDRLASTHPDAAELCNGIDDDCDDLPFEGSGVGFVDSRGETTDLTSTFEAGTSSSPFLHRVTEAGELWLCEGTWTGTIVVEADAVITSEGEPEDVVIDAADADTAIFIDTVSSAEVSHLTLQGGVGRSYYSTGAYTYGGSLLCYDSDDVVLEDLVLRDSSADVGGCLGLVSCAGDFSQLDISDCASVLQGGGVYNGQGGSILSDSTIRDCTTEGDGGGLYSNSHAGSYRIDLERVLIEDNHADGDGGGLVLSDGWMIFDCTGSTEPCGILGSTGGGAYVTRLSTTSYLWFTLADLGRTGDSDDNSPFDVYLEMSGGDEAYDDFGDDTTVTCSTSTGCD